MDQKVREMFYRVKTSAADMGKTAGKYANDIVEQTKLSYQIFERNGQIEATYKKIGALMYDLHRGKEVSNEEIDEMLIQADRMHLELMVMKEKLAELKKVNICPGCHRETNKNFEFCPSCGAKIHAEASPEADEKVMAEVVEEDFEKAAAEAETAEEKFEKAAAEAEAAINAAYEAAENDPG